MAVGSVFDRHHVPTAEPLEFFLAWVVGMFRIALHTCTAHSVADTIYDDASL